MCIAVRWPLRCVNSLVICSSVIGQRDAKVKQVRPAAANPQGHMPSPACSPRRKCRRSAPGHPATLPCLLLSSSSYCFLPSQSSVLALFLHPRPLQTHTFSILSPRDTPLQLGDFVASRHLQAVLRILGPATQKPLTTPDFGLRSAANILNGDHTNPSVSPSVATGTGA